MIECEECNNEIMLNEHHHLCDDCFYTKVKPKTQMVSFDIDNDDDKKTLISILAMNGYKVWYGDICDSNKTISWTYFPTINVIIED